MLKINEPLHTIKGLTNSGDPIRLVLSYRCICTIQKLEYNDTCPDCGGRGFIVTNTGKEIEDFISYCLAYSLSRAVK